MCTVRKLHLVYLVGPHTEISGFSKYFSSSDVITAGFLVALLSDCVDMLFLDVLLFRSCRSDELPYCGFESSFSRIILCFDLRNIVGTLCSTATCTSIGNFLWQMPSQASLTSTAKKTLLSENVGYKWTVINKSVSVDYFLQS